MDGTQPVNGKPGRQDALQPTVLPISSLPDVLLGVTGNYQYLPVNKLERPLICLRSVLFQQFGSQTDGS